MCGIAGSLTVGSASSKTSMRDLERMGRSLAHRGPDGSGLFCRGHVKLAHRRLAVVETGATGAQPMLSVDGRWVIVYNGELYNTDEVRTQLVREGAAFRGRSDTEVVMQAVARWGAGAMSRLRGMYAFVCVDLQSQVAIMARDPLGIKPLYWATLGPTELLFASETQSILSHSQVSAVPDLVGMSTYISTIRTTLGGRTLFENVHCLLPGEWLTVGFAGESLRITRADWWEIAAPREAFGGGDLADLVKDEVIESVRRHMHADVPWCSLLSGGLDSTILAAVATRSAPGLHTYCSGSADGDDFRFAAEASAHLSTRHHEAPVTRPMFLQRWTEMVERMGTPLSTPNEVAINEVARTMRAGGHVMALSGEGADELFGGYAILMAEAERYFKGGGTDGATLALNQASWVRVEQKPALLRDEVWNALNGDRELLETYQSEWLRLSLRGGDDMQTVLQMQRRINLAGLLQRLDTAMMLEGVEGRTPFADQRIACLAEMLPMGQKFVPETADEGGGGVAVETRVRAAQSKAILRQAFADCVPRGILERPKASFPLPFQEWIGELSGIVTTSPLVRAVFNEAAIEAVANQPKACWQFAWPMMNLALWGKRWW